MCQFYLICDKLHLFPNMFCLLVLLKKQTRGEGKCLGIYFPLKLPPPTFWLHVTQTYTKFWHQINAEHQALSGLEVMVYQPHILYYIILAEKGVVKIL